MVCGIGIFNGKLRQEFMEFYMQGRHGKKLGNFGIIKLLHAGFPSRLDIGKKCPMNWENWYFPSCFRLVLYCQVPESGLNK